ncbi:MAG: hypothetical protein K2L19_05990 [Eubacterium sp.]|nr:hypothetical protein [Eubacterium sp.]
MKKKKGATENCVIEDLKKAIPVLNYIPIDYSSSDKWFNFVNAGLFEQTNEILNSVNPDEFTADMLDPYIDAMVNYEINNLSKQLADHLHSLTNHFGKVKGSTQEIVKNLEYLQRDLQDIEDELEKYTNIKKSLEEKPNDKY